MIFRKEEDLRTVRPAKFVSCGIFINSFIRIDIGSVSSSLEIKNNHKNSSNISILNCYHKNTQK